MKKLFYLVRHWGLEGLDWMEDGYMQVMYVSAIISELLILHIIKLEKVMIYAILFAVHLALLAFCGYKKCQYKRKKKGKIYKIIFQLTCVYMWAGMCDYTSCVEATTISLIPFFMASIQFEIMEWLFEIAEQKSLRVLRWVDLQVEYNTGWYIVMMITLPIISVGIPLLLLKWSVYVRIVIFIAYLLSIPFISRCAKPGINIFYMFRSLLD